MNKQEFSEPDPGLDQPQPYVGPDEMGGMWSSFQEPHNQYKTFGNLHLEGIHIPTIKMS